jgi:hypothetical protein
MVEGLAVLGERDEAARPARILIDRNALGDREKAREPLTETIAMHRQVGVPKHVGRRCCVGSRRPLAASRVR